MAATVLEERLQRRIRRERRDGIQRGIEQAAQQALADTRDLLASQVARKFGPGTAARTTDLLAEIRNAAGLRRAAQWIIDCPTPEELLDRLKHGQNPNP